MGNQVSGSDHEESLSSERRETKDDDSVSQSTFYSTVKTGSQVPRRSPMNHLVESNDTQDKPPHGPSHVDQMITTTTTTDATFPTTPPRSRITTPQKETSHRPEFSEDHVWIDPILAAAAVGAAESRSRVEQQRFASHSSHSTSRGRQFQTNRGTDNRHYDTHDWKASWQRFATTAVSTATTVATVAGPILSDAAAVMKDSVQAVSHSAKEIQQSYQTAMREQSNFDAHHVQDDDEDDNEANVGMMTTLVVEEPVAMEAPQPIASGKYGGADFQPAIPEEEEDPQRRDNHDGEKSDNPETRMFGTPTSKLSMRGWDDMKTPIRTHRKVPETTTPASFAGNYGSSYAPHNNDQGTMPTIKSQLSPGSLGSSHSRNGITSLASESAGKRQRGMYLDLRVNGSQGSNQSTVSNRQAIHREEEENLLATPRQFVELVSRKLASQESGYPPIYRRGRPSRKSSRGVSRAGSITPRPMMRTWSRDTHVSMEVEESIFAQERHLAPSRSASLSPPGSPSLSVASSVSENPPRNLLVPPSTPVVTFWDMMPEIEPDSSTTCPKPAVVLEPGLKLILENTPRFVNSSMGSKSGSTFSSGGVSCPVSTGVLSNKNTSVARSHDSGTWASDPGRIPQKRRRNYGRMRRKIKRSKSRVASPESGSEESSLVLRESLSFEPLRDIDEQALNHQNQPDSKAFPWQSPEADDDGERLIPPEHRDDMLNEALLAFSSLKRIDFCEGFQIRNISSPLERLALIRWRQLTANWRHNEVTKAITMRPCSLHFNSDAGHDVYGTIDGSLSSSTDRSRSFVRHSPFLLNRRGSSVMQNLSGFHPLLCDVDLPTLTSFIGKIGPPQFDVDDSLSRRPRFGGKLAEPVLRHHPGDVSELLRIAEAEFAPFSVFVAKIAACSINFSYSTKSSARVPYSVSIKTASSIQLKAQRKYNGDILQVKDILRAQVVFPDESSLACALAHLNDLSAGVQDICEEAKGMKIERVKNLFRVDHMGNFVSKSLPTGYRHILVNVRLADGMLSEIQLQLAQMFDVLAEKGYDLHRQITEADMPCSSKASPRDSSANVSRNTLSCNATSARNDTDVLKELLEHMISTSASKEAEEWYQNSSRVCDQSDFNDVHEFDLYRQSPPFSEQSIKNGASKILSSKAISSEQRSEGVVGNEDTPHENNVMSESVGDRGISGGGAPAAESTPFRACGGNQIQETIPSTESSHRPPRIGRCGITVPADRDAGSQQKSNEVDVDDTSQPSEVKELPSTLRGFNIAATDAFKQQQAAEGDEQMIGISLEPSEQLSMTGGSRKSEVDVPVAASRNQQTPIEEYNEETGPFSERIEQQRGLAGGGVAVAAAAAARKRQQAADQSTEETSRCSELSVPSSTIGGDDIGVAAARERQRTADENKDEDTTPDSALIVPLFPRGGGIAAAATAAAAAWNHQNSTARATQEACQSVELKKRPSIAGVNGVAAASDAAAQNREPVESKQEATPDSEFSMASSIIRGDGIATAAEAQKWQLLADENVDKTTQLTELSVPSTNGGGGIAAAAAAAACTRQEKDDEKKKEANQYSKLNLPSTAIRDAAGAAAALKLQQEADENEHEMTESSELRIQSSNGSGGIAGAAAAAARKRQQKADVSTEKTIPSSDSSVLPSSFVDDDISVDAAPDRKLQQMADKMKEETTQDLEPNALPATFGGGEIAAAAAVAAHKLQQVADENDHEMTASSELSVLSTNRGSGIASAAATQDANQSKEETTLDSGSNMLPFTIEGGGKSVAAAADHKLQHMADEMKEQTTEDAEPSALPSAFGGGGIAAAAAAAARLRRQKVDKSKNETIPDSELSVPSLTIRGDVLAEAAAVAAPKRQHVAEANDDVTTQLSELNVPPLTIEDSIAAVAARKWQQKPDESKEEATILSDPSVPPSGIRGGGIDAAAAGAARRRQEAVGANVDETTTQFPPLSAPSLAIGGGGIAAAAAGAACKRQPKVDENKGETELSVPVVAIGGGGIAAVAAAAGRKRQQAGNESKKETNQYSELSVPSSTVGGDGKATSAAVVAARNHQKSIEGAVQATSQSTAFRIRQSIVEGGGAAEASFAAAPQESSDLPVRPFLYTLIGVALQDASSNSRHVSTLCCLHSLCEFALSTCNFEAPEANAMPCKTTLRYQLLAPSRANGTSRKVSSSNNIYPGTSSSLDSPATGSEGLIRVARTSQVVATAASLRQTDERAEGAGPMPLVGGGIAAAAAAAARLRGKWVSNDANDAVATPLPEGATGDGPNASTNPSDGIVGSAPPVASGAQLDQTDDNAEKAGSTSLGGGGIAAAAAAAAAARMRNRKMSNNANEMAVSSLPEGSVANESSIATNPAFGGGGIAAAAAAAARRKQTNEGNDGAGSMPLVGGGIAAAAAAAARLRGKEVTSDANDAVVTTRSEGATGDGPHVSTNPSDEIGGTAPPVASGAQLGQTDDSAEKAGSTSLGGGGIAAAAAAAAAARMRNRKMLNDANEMAVSSLSEGSVANESSIATNPAFGGGGIAAAAAAAARLKRTDERNEGAGSMSLGVEGTAAAVAGATARLDGREGFDEAEDVVATKSSGMASFDAVSEAHANFDLVGLHIFEAEVKGDGALLRRNGSLPHKGVAPDIATYDGQNSDFKLDLAVLQQVNESALLRCLNIANQAVSVGMTGWLEYGSSNLLDRTVGRPLDVMCKLAFTYARRNSWLVAIDILRALVLRCEQHLPLYHPFTLSTILDLAAAMTVVDQTAKARKLVGRVTERLAFYLSEQEDAYLDFRDQLLSERSEGRIIFDSHTGIDHVSMLKTFACMLQRLVNRDFLRLFQPDHEVILLNRSLIGDSFAVLANCVVLSEESRGDRDSPKTMSATYWNVSYKHYRFAFESWIRKGRNLHHPNVMAASCSVARCLRELGERDRAIRILTSVIATKEGPPWAADKDAKLRMEDKRVANVVDDSDSLPMTSFLPPTMQDPTLALRARVSVGNEQCTALSLWSMAAYTVESSPDERGRIRALSLLHAGSEALRRALNETDDCVAGRQVICREMLKCIEQEASELFQPLQAVASEIFREDDGGMNNAFPRMAGLTTRATRMQARFRRLPMRTTKDDTDSVLA